MGTYNYKDTLKCKLKAVQSLNGFLLCVPVKFGSTGNEQIIG